MRSFVDQQGVPVLSVTRGKGGVTLRQKRYAALGVADVPATTGRSQCACVRARRSNAP